MAQETFLNGSTRIRVQHLASNAVRITHAPPGEGDFPADRPWLKEVLLSGELLDPQAGRLAVDAPEGLVRICDSGGAEVLAEALPPILGRTRRLTRVHLDIPATELRLELGRARETVTLALRIAPGEAFYGWGERFDAFRRERGSLRLRAVDAIPLRQRRDSYSAIPCFLSSRGYMFLLLNSHESAWRIDPSRGILRIAALGPGADYLVIAGSFREILSTYTRLTGRPPLPPRWALGLMVTGYPQEHQGVVLERVHQHRLLSVPLDAVVLDYHWEERFHNLRWRSALFPRPDEFIAELKALGVRLGLILTPFLNRRNRPLQRLLLQLLARNRPWGTALDDERDLPGYAEAQERGYLAHPRVRWWFGLGGMVDFSNPEAAAWWNGRLRPLYEQGVAFFKNDDGEYLPPKGRSALGMGGREYRNLYGFFYGRALYEGMAQLDERRPFVYARAVWAGSQRYPAMFLGDQTPSSVSMRAALRAGLNLGLAGFSYWTADCFGLSGRTVPETHMRYAQWALLCPVARYFWRPPDVDDTRYPWSHNPDVEANFRAYAQLRYRLLPYYYALADEAYRTGLPIVRPMLLEFPRDERFAATDDQFMLGDRLLVAPVLEPRATSRRILLPEGTWHDFWSGAVYEGGAEITYAAPLDRLPLLVRGGTVLALGPERANIPDDHAFDHLLLHVWPPYPAEGWFYDDDGRTRAYQRGACSRTRFSAREEEGRVVVRIAPAEGDFPGQVPSRRVEIVLHQVQALAEARVNGQPAQEWEHKTKERTARVVARCPVDEETVVDFRF